MITFKEEPSIPGYYGATQHVAVRIGTSDRYGRTAQFFISPLSEVEGQKWVRSEFNVLYKGKGEDFVAAVQDALADKLDDATQNPDKQRIIIGDTARKVGEETYKHEVRNSGQSGEQAM